MSSSDSSFVDDRPYYSIPSLDSPINALGSAPLRQSHHCSDLAYQSTPAQSDDSRHKVHFSEDLDSDEPVFRSKLRPTIHPPLILLPRPIIVKPLQKQTFISQSRVRSLFHPPTSHINSYADTKPSLKRRVRFSEEVACNMPSDGEGAGGSSYVDDRPQSERNSDRKRGDAENSYAHLNAATANESGDPPVDIDPRTGRPREYEISRWGRRVPKSPYPPRFRLSDAMFMRPAPGVQRPVQEVPPGEKDWSKVKYRNLPGIPSGHRWHIRNPETGEVESTSGSIMNDPVKPPLFIPWTVDRLPGRKAPNSDIKAKWNAEAERAKHRHRKDMRATVETENDSSDATPLTPAALRRRSSARFRAQTRAVWKIVPKKATTDNKPVAKKGRDTTTKGPDLASAAAKADSSAGHKDAAGNVTLSIGTREKAIEELLKEITERRGRDQEDWRREREEDQVQRRQEREEDRTDRRRERDEDRKERQEEWKNFREMLERDRERDLEDRREAQKETAELFNKMFEKMGRLNRKPDALGSDGGSTTSVSKNKNFSVSGNGAYQQSPKQATREFNFKKRAKWGVSNAGENDKLDVADKSPLVKKPGDWSFKNSEQSVDGGENNMKTDDLDPTEPNRASTTGKKVSFGTDIFGLGDNDETAKTKDGEKNTGKDDNVVGFGSSAFKFDGSESIGKKSGLARRAAEERAGNEENSRSGWDQIPPPPPGGDDVEGWKTNWIDEW